MFKVRCTKTRDGRFIKGKIYTVGKHGGIPDENGYTGYNCPTDSFESWYEACCWSDYDFEPAVSDAHKIVITTDGNKTLARLYDGKKVVKSAAAKCAPNDTFDFATGANLAYNRLMYGTDYNPAEVAFEPKPEDKPKYKVGDKARIIADTCNHEQATGKVITLEEVGWRYAMSSNRPAWGIVGTDKYISERDIEPYIEDKPTVKLYCVKDYGSLFTKGKTYSLKHNCPMESNNNAFILTHDSLDSFFHTHPQLKTILVPLVARAAKVGEMIISEWSGTLYKVIERNANNNGVMVSDRCYLLDENEYLVLDGFKPTCDKCGQEIHDAL